MTMFRKRITLHPSQEIRLGSHKKVLEIKEVWKQCFTERMR